MMSKSLYPNHPQPPTITNHHQPHPSHPRVKRMSKSLDLGDQPRELGQDGVCRVVEYDMEPVILNGWGAPRASAHAIGSQAPISMRHAWTLSRARHTSGHGSCRVAWS